ncbi:dihydrodipicolinate synthase family protein [Niabella terrae]
MNDRKPYSGVFVPAVTPLTRSLQIDAVAVQQLFGLLYKYGCAPFILGTTGEAASLSMQQKLDYIRIAGEVKEQGSLLLVGISSNVLEESQQLAAYCGDHGVDALVATLPAYYPLTPAQQLAYFLHLADTSPLPLFIYNIPATTHMSLPLALVDQLSRHPNIIGLKDSERDEARMRAALALWKDRPDFHYLLGWAAKSAEALLGGADGLVPSTGNYHPEIYQQMFQALTAGNQEEIFRLQELSDQYGASYQKDRTLGESLAALKLLMQEQGTCSACMLPPLSSLTASATKNYQS